MSKQHICNCCVTGCSNTASLKPDLAFFSIPTDKRRDQWLSLISREDLREITPLSRSRRICEDHFSRDAILFTNMRKTLKKTALPSQCLPPLEDNTRTMNEADIPTTSKSTVHLASKLTQTDDDWDDEIEESIVVELDPSIRSEEEQNTAFYDLCDKYLTKDLASLIKAEDSLRFKNFVSNAENYSQFCFNLYKISPQAYQFFQTIYDLPNSDIFLKESVQTGTKVSDTALLALKSRINKMSAKEKNCSVLIESIKLKKNLCYNIKEDKIYGFQEIYGVQSSKLTTVAIVMMIRGLFSNWKQPIGYILHHQSDNITIIQNWMDELIKKLFDIGLNVRTLVWSTKDEIICENSISIDNPFFFVNDKKIYQIFDAPELIKSARNCLVSHNIYFQNKVAKYKDVVKFYNIDQKKALPYAHKLTESHISPKTKKEKQDVKYAVELMSNTVASGLWNYMHFKLIKDANIGTVEFISKMNDVFDILNVSKQNHNDTKRKKAFSQKENHGDVNETLLYFQNLKVINSKHGQDRTLSVKFIKGILITVKAISLLSDDLKTEGYTELLTRNLHLEVLDNFIKRLTSCIKRKPQKPTTLQFTVAFRKLFLSNLKNFTQRGSSKCEVTNFLAQTHKLDEELALSYTTRKDLRNVSLESLTNMSRPSTYTDDDIKIVRKDYKRIDRPEKHSLMYICGHLLKKSKKNHKVCQILREYLSSHKDQSSLEIGRFRRYDQYMKTALQDLPAAPCDYFIQFVKEMDEKVVEALTNNLLNPRIVDSLYKNIAEISFTPPCPCFPKKYMVKLFIRIRIFYTIRTNNNFFKTDRRNRQIIEIPKL